MVVEDDEYSALEERYNSNIECSLDFLKKKA
jgi:hypothetical protein